MSSNQEVQSNEVEKPQSPNRLAISELAIETFNFAWNIGNFRYLRENWFNFGSVYLDFYPKCCQIAFLITRELAQKQSDDEQNSWIFTILTDVTQFDNKYRSFEDDHLKDKHSIRYHNCNQYLMGSNGKKKFVENGSLAKRKFVVQLSDDQLKEGSEYLNSGFLEFRVELQVTKLLSRKGGVLLSKSLDPSENLAENLGDLLENHVLSDLTIKTDDGSFEAHKAILAARSLVFERMFTINMKEKEENSVTIHGVDSETMRVFLRYIYEDKLEFDDSATIDLKLDILQLAEQYQIPRLKALCELELIKSLDAESIFKILIVADTFNAMNLRENGLHFVKLHKLTLAKHEDISLTIGNSKELGRDIFEALTG